MTNGKIVNIKGTVYATIATSPVGSVAPNGELKTYLLRFASFAEKRNGSELVNRPCDELYVLDR